MTSRGFGSSLYSPVFKGLSFTRPRCSSVTQALVAGKRRFVPPSPAATISCYNGYYYCSEGQFSDRCSATHRVQTLPKKKKCPTAETTDPILFAKKIRVRL